MQWLLAAIAILFVPILKAEESIVHEATLPPWPAPIFAPITMGEEHLEFMGLNLSTNTMSLDKKHQSLLGELLAQEKRITSAGEVKHVPKYRVSNPIRLGTLPLEIKGAGVEDQSRFLMFTGFPFDGFLGLETLMDCRFELFYGQEKFRIKRGPANEAELAGFQRAPVSILMTLPVIELEVHGVMEHFFLDSSGNSFLSLNEKTFERFAEAGIIKPEATIGESTDQGYSNVQAGRVVNLELFGRKLNGTLVSSAKGSQNTLGTAFLRGFDSVLDLPGRTFWYRPIKIKRQVLDVNAMTGMRIIYFQGAAVGMAIQEGGPAEAAGISQYDRLDRLGTLTKGSFNLITLQEACQTYQGKEVEIEFYHHSTDTHIKAKMKMPAAIYDRTGFKE